MRSKVQSAAGVVIALFALATAFGLPYSFASEYGGSGYALVAVVTAPLCALGTWLTFGRNPWALAGGLVLSVAATLAGGVLGQAEHDRARQARASACSPDERSEFQALEAIPTNGEYGSGDSDGSCRASFGGRTQPSLDGLRQAAQGRGWEPVGAEIYVREGKRLRIEVTDEGEKGLDISLVFERHPS